MTTKKCNTCGITKPVSDYYKRGDDKTKYHAECKVCSAKATAERLKNPINRKKYNESNKIRNAKARREQGIPERAPGTGNLRWKGACTIIKKHHETMKDDPERLSTEFIQNLMGRKCKD
jgi:hypothetical protein